MPELERITISLDTTLAQAFDALSARRGYVNRSEAIRDLLRAEIERGRQEQGVDGHCVACLSYVYNHHEADLAERLMSLQHAHHDLTVATMHAHMDHEHCLETTLLRGPAAAVRAFADALLATRGVHHGQLNLISAELHQSHRHGHDAAAHLHLRPAS